MASSISILRNFGIGIGEARRKARGSFPPALWILSADTATRFFRVTRTAWLRLRRRKAFEQLTPPALHDQKPGIGRQIRFSWRRGE
jgi:hypothetical protein